MAEQIGLEAILDVSQFNKGLKTYLSGLDKMDTQTSRTGKGISGKFAGAGKSILGFGAVAGGAALAGVVGLAAGVGVLGVASVQTAISFESAFAGVLKTTDGLTDSMGNLNTQGQELRAGFVDLSKEVPLAFEELAAIGELGGQLGIGKDALLDFTETIAALGVSTNLTTEEAATAIAQMGNIYQVAADDMGKNTAQVGSTIVALGNNFATTERDIVAFGGRLAGAGAIAGLTQAEVLAIGAAMSSVGVQAEAGGTATQKVLLGINNAVNATSDGFVDNTKAIETNVEKLQDLNAKSAQLEAQAPGLQQEILAQFDAFIAAGGSAEEFGRQLGDKTVKAAFDTASAIRGLETETQLLRDSQGQPVDAGQLQKFAAIAGLSADEFKQAWQDDAAGAFQLFVEGIGQEGDNAVNALNDLGLADQRLIRSFLALGGAGDLLSRTMDVANTAFDENTALSNEAAQRYATTESQLAILKNTLRATGDTIGSRFLPFLNRAIEIGAGLIDEWADPLADVLDNVVIPAIDNFISKFSAIFTLFDQFGVAGAAGGIMAMLGFGPDAITQVQGFIDSISGLFSEDGFLSELFSVSSFSEAIGLIIAQAPIALQGLIDSISQFLIDSWPIISETLQGWADMFFGWVNESVVPAIPEVLSAVIEGITTWATEQLPVIQSAMAEWSAGFWDWVQTVITSAGESLAGIIASIGLWAASGETQSQLNEMGFALGEALVTGITNLLEDQERIVSILTQVVTGLAIGAAAITGLLIAVGAQIVAGIISGIIESLGGELEPTTLTKLGEVLTGIGENALTAASIIGTNIILGISQGLLDTISELTTTLEQIGTIIVETVKDVLGISSPSTIFFQFGIDIIQGLINGILSLAGTVTETIGTVIGSLFGGGEGEAATPSFDPAEMLDGRTQVEDLMAQIDTRLLNLIEVQLPLLTEAVILMVSATVPMWTQILTLLTQLNTLLITIATSSLPLVQAAAVATTQIMINGFTEVNAILQQVIASLNQMVTALNEVAGASEEATTAMEDLADVSLDDLISDLDTATGAAESLAAALAMAAGAAGNVGGALAAQGIGASGGLGARAGLGFQGGTGPLGFLVPPGHPNDSFPINVTSGERVVVSRPSQSIEEVVAPRMMNLLAGSGGGQVVTIQIGPNNLSTQLDLAMLEATVSRVVTRI